MLKRNWALIALVYFAFAEVLSWTPVPDLSLCLIQPEHSEQSSDHDNEKYCPAFHVGAALAFEKVNTLLEAHDKSVVGGFTIVLAISTIGLWFATNKLWVAGEKQIEFLRESAESQARDMQASITAAKKSADAAMLAIGSERAWVSYERLVAPRSNKGLLDGIPFTRCVGFVVEWKNRGRSPATRMQIVTDFAIIPVNADYAPHFEARWKISPATAPLGPDGVAMGEMRAAADEVYDSITNRQNVFILYSSVRYHDVFNSELIRTTEICLRIEYNGEVQGPDGAMHLNWKIEVFGPQNSVT